MKKLIVYYAHCIAIYDTPQEKRDVDTLEALGWIVINPNCAACKIGYRKEGMAFFHRFAETCDIIAFRALPDGSIPLGVAGEIAMFKEKNKLVIELPSAVGRRILSLSNTREYLLECGQR
jgi:hypothetical protein